MALKRVFVAVELTTETRHAMAAVLEDIPGRRVPPQNWHVTLRFVGPIDDVGLDRLSGALGDADLGPRFRLKWEGLGAFPRASKATVLWAGVGVGSQPLVDLAARVESAVVSAGFADEDRPFRPHLTLSRLRPQRDVSDLVAGHRPIALPMAVDHVAVMESHLGRGGVRYHRLDSFPLALGIEQTFD